MSHREIDPSKLGYDICAFVGMFLEKGSLYNEIVTQLESIEEITADHQIKVIQQSWQENAIAQSLTASQENRIYFATYAKWNGINGPTGNELVLEQLGQFFAE